MCAWDDSKMSEKLITRATMCDKFDASCRDGSNVRAFDFWINTITKYEKKINLWKNKIKIDRM